MKKSHIPPKELKDGTPRVFSNSEDKDEMDIDLCKETVMKMAFEAAFADKFEAMDKHPSIPFGDSTFN